MTQRHLHALRVVGLLVPLCTLCVPALAQSRLAVLLAEDRRAPTAADLATIRGGTHGPDVETTRAAVRALGRLERPSLVPDILPLLRHPSPDVRAEAANAVGQAMHARAADAGKTSPVLDSALAALAARLKVEAEPEVRAATAETIGRLPFATAAQADKADQVLVDFATRSETVTDRLGIAKAFEAYTRVNLKLRPLSADALAILQRDVTPGGAEATIGARVRRLALEALITAKAASDDVVAAAAKDQDAQVRRLAARAAGTTLLPALARDDSPIVRIEALRQLAARGGSDACPPALAALTNRSASVALTAIDALAACGDVPEAVPALDGEIEDAAARGWVREAWHRAAHAIVSLAAANVEHARRALPRAAAAPVWQVRMYAARAAAALPPKSDAPDEAPSLREVLTRLASDENDNVREAAVAGLKKTAGHDADRVYLAQLSRTGYQILRAAALALEGTPDRDAAVPALRAAFDRLVAEHRDNSHDARKAIAAALASLGEAVKPALLEAFTPAGAAPDLNADDLRRLAAPRARVTIRDVGVFELQLVTLQAPASVLRFAHLAESGYYNGLTFHRVVPDFVIQGGSPGANEYVGDARFMRDEVGLWPHVRGAVGISTRGRDTGDAQIFVDLVDNPRLDHEYTVFAQVLNGIDVVDRILEGDVIERIEILP